jgi:crossover junction endodeoxyribonuclease RuvC
MLVLGIDPGSVSGAYAVLDSRRDTVIHCDDLPVIEKQVNAVEFAKILRQIKPDQAVIELVGSMPKQGISSTFRFGVAIGLVRGVVATLQVPLHQVTPTKWKRAFSLGSDGEESRALASRLYPGLNGLSRKKDHNRAEAILLARWYVEHHTQGVERGVV